MSGRTSRMQRQAARLTRNDREVEFDARVGQAKRDRDEALRRANADYEAGLAHLRTERTKARKAANTDFETAREALLRSFFGETAA